MRRAATLIMGDRGPFNPEQIWSIEGMPHGYYVCNRRNLKGLRGVQPFGSTADRPGRTAREPVSVGSRLYRHGVAAISKAASAMASGRPGKCRDSPSIAGAWIVPAGTHEGAPVRLNGTTHAPGSRYCVRSYRKASPHAPVGCRTCRTTNLPAPPPVALSCVPERSVRSTVETKAGQAST